MGPKDHVACDCSWRQICQIPLCFRWHWNNWRLCFIPQCSYFHRWQSSLAVQKKCMLLVILRCLKKLFCRDAEFCINPQRVPKVDGTSKWFLCCETVVVDDLVGEHSLICAWNSRRESQANFTKLNNRAQDSEIRHPLQLIRISGFWTLEVACILSISMQGWRQVFPAFSWPFWRTVRRNSWKLNLWRKPLELCRNRKRHHLASFASLH